MSSPTRLPLEQLRPGVALVWSGAWAVGHSYLVNYLVSHGGNVWISLLTQVEVNSTTEPGVGENADLCWDLFIPKGEKGDPGDALGEAVRETPSGTLDGTNAIFVLAYALVAGTEQVFLNGILQDPGSGNDYTISSRTITFLTPPASTDKIRVNYTKA